MKREAQRQKRLLRTKGAGEYVGISDWSIRSLIATGELPYVQLAPGAPFLIDVRDLDALIERSKISREPR